MNYCTALNQDIYIVLDIIPDAYQEIGTDDITILIGEPDIWEGKTAYQLGWEEIVLIKNINSDVRLTSIELIRQEFTSNDPTFNIWTYPQGNKLWEIFEDAILDGRSMTPYALIAPNPGEMLESVSSDPNGIGYIPTSWLTEGVLTISIEPSIRDSLRKPILALTREIPDPSVQSFLACLQSNWK